MMLLRHCSGEIVSVFASVIVDWTETEMRIKKKIAKKSKEKEMTKIPQKVVKKL